MAALTEEQGLIRDQAKSWATEQSPVTKFRKLRDEKVPNASWPDAWQAMIDMGWTGILVPVAHGGSDLGFLTFGLILEELWSQPAGFIQRFPEKAEGVIVHRIFEKSPAARSPLKREMLITHAAGQRVGTVRQPDSDQAVAGHRAGGRPRERLGDAPHDGRAGDRRGRRRRGRPRERCRPTAGAGEHVSRER